MTTTYESVAAGEGVARPSAVPTTGRTTEQRALRVVTRYKWACGGVGIIPLPLFDQLAIGGLLARMLHEIGGLYGVQFSDQKAKALVAAALGGAHAQWITYAPVINMVGTVFTRPVIAVGIVHAIGKLFIHHFETGAWR